MINKLKNTPVRDLIRALEQDGFQYKRRKKEVKEFIGTMMGVVL